MKALVLGGNRYFGRHLVEKLISDGAQVTILNRGRHTDSFGDRVERIVCDRKNTDTLLSLVRRKTYDVVYDQICYDANEARAACRVFKGVTPLYIFTSTASVYGSGANMAESEFEPRKHRFTKTVEVTQDYAEAKREAESVFFLDAKFRVIAARFPVVCGADDYTGRLGFHVIAAMNGEKIRFPKLSARLSFISSQDAGNVLKRLSETEFEGPINCASPDSISMQELMDLIERVTGKKGQFIEGTSGGELSPFGISDDWYMSTKRLQTLKINVRPLDKWLPDVIREIYTARLKNR